MEVVASQRKRLREHSPDEQELEHDIEIEREELDRHVESPPSNPPLLPLRQQLLVPTATPLAFLDPIQPAPPNVVVPNSAYMPRVGTVINGVSLKPKPSTQAYSGNVLLGVAPMGSGKTTMVKEHIKSFIIEQHRLGLPHRVLYLTANRLFAASNATMLKQVAQELRDQGLSHVTAAGYMDADNDLAAHTARPSLHCPASTHQHTFSCSAAASRRRSSIAVSNRCIGSTGSCLRWSS